MDTQRAWDVVVATGLGVVTWPALVAAAVAIPVVDRQSPWFVQTRVGRGRRPFRVHKLQTMRDGEPTPLGRWLRRARIDELPQLYDVLRGEMSLVGPRPITQADVVRLGWDAHGADLRWRVRPGITGPTQLSTVCDGARALGRDCRYAVRRSVWSDAVILGATLLKPLVGAQRAEALTARWQ